VLEWLKRLLGKKEEHRVKYCGGIKSVRHKRRHRKSGKHFEPSTEDPKIIKKSVEKYVPSDIAEPTAAIEPPMEAVLKHEILMAKWRPFIRLLKERGTIDVNRNVYYGSLRGIDVILHAKRDLRRLGYDVSIKTKGRDGSITLNRGEAT